MKEECISSQAVIYQLNEARTSNVNRAIMVPYGYPKNFGLYDKAKEGDYVHFKDEKLFKIKSKMTVFVNSPMAECMAQMIYGLPMREVFQKFKDKHNKDIQDEKVIILIYEPKNYTPVARDGR